VRIFLAGATGVIGVRLVPLLVAAGHDVIGMTRTPDKLRGLEDAGAVGVLCDVFDATSLTVAVAASRPDVVMHQLTDLPDDLADIALFGPGHARIRREGTANLLAAAEAAAVPKVIAQSVAWELAGDAGRAVEDLEAAVLAYPGVVLRYGQFHGPGTYHATARPDGPRIQIDAAAARTVDHLDAQPGIVTIVDDDGAAG
jgi:uncharacterized protein YbjT (DUF2867 family)